MLSTLAFLVLTAAQLPAPPAPEEAALPPALEAPPAAAPSENALPIPVMEGALMARPDGSPVPARPVPPRRPWWTLGVSESAYRMVLPHGPDQGTLSPEETERFWKVYADLRRESIALDASELALMAAPVLVLVGGALVIPFLGVPAVAERFLLSGTTSEKLVKTAFVLTPLVSFATLAVAGLCGLGVVALTALDAQDNGSPALPVKVTPAGTAAVKAGARQDLRHLFLSGAVFAVVIPCALVAVIAPFVLPWVLGALLGQSPAVMLRTWRVALSDNGSLFGVGAVASYVAVTLLAAGIPLLMATGYATQAAADAFGLEENPNAQGDTRDISTFLNPFNILLGRRPPPPAPAPQPE